MARTPTIQGVHEIFIYGTDAHYIQSGYADSSTIEILRTKFLYIQTVEFPVTESVQQESNEYPH